MKGKMAADSCAASKSPHDAKRRIRVLIADDHTLIRLGLKALLFDAEGIEVVGEAGDGREAVAEVERLKPDVVLMDVVMPEMDGAQATAAIRGGRTEARVLAISGSGVEVKIFAALRAGALGYIAKTCTREELLNAIVRVDRGRPAMAPELTLRLIEKYEPTASVREPLTQREIEILRWVARGLSNQEIASELHLSEGTVRTHLSHVFGKLGVGNRVEATLCALRDRLTTLDECLASTGTHS